MMYILPTMTLIFAVALFGEPFGLVRLIAFCFIWVALIIYSTESILKSRNGKHHIKPPEHFVAGQVNSSDMADHIKSGSDSNSQNPETETGNG
jgi:hypothetical protein